MVTVVNAISFRAILRSLPWHARCCPGRACVHVEKRQSSRSSSRSAARVWRGRIDRRPGSEPRRRRVHAPRRSPRAPRRAPKTQSAAERRRRHARPRRRRLSLDDSPGTLAGSTGTLVGRVGRSVVRLRTWFLRRGELATARTQVVDTHGRPLSLSRRTPKRVRQGSAAVRQASDATCAVRRPPRRERCHPLG